MERARSGNRWRSRVWLVEMLILFMLGVSCAPSGAIVTIEQETLSLRVNETARVFVTAKNISDLTAFEVHLSFDASTLEVIELNGGGFLREDFMVQNSFDNSAGTVDYAVAQITQPPASGSGILLEIRFRARADGKSSILFREMPAVPDGVLLSDSDGMAVPVSLKNTSIQVGEE